MTKRVATITILGHDDPMATPSDIILDGVMDFSVEEILVISQLFARVGAHESNVRSMLLNQLNNGEKLNVNKTNG